MELDNIKIGERIKSIRLNQGYTMEEFGKNFSTSKGTVNNWEKGRNLPNKENLLKIAKIGDVDLDILLFGNDNIHFIEQAFDNIFDEYIKISKMYKFDSENLINKREKTKKFIINKVLSNPEIKNMNFYEINNLISSEIELETSLLFSSFLVQINKIKNEMSKLQQLLESENEIQIYSGDTTINFDELKINLKNFMEYLLKIYPNV